MSGPKKTDDPQIKKLQKNLHAGHRQRVRQRFLGSGIESFYDHEVLEFLLFYAIPRRNTNPSAHMLLSRFGSLSGVFDATKEDLQTIPGIGPKAARMLRIFSPLLLRLSADEKRESFPVCTSSDVHTLLQKRIDGRTAPALFILLLSGTGQYQGVRTISCTELPSLRRILESVIYTNATKLILVEYAISVGRRPDEAHLQQIRQLVKGLRTLEYPVCDYFLLPDPQHRPISLRQRGQFI